MTALTEREVQSIAFAAANHVADRLSAAIKEELAGMGEDRRLAIALHAATCPTKARVDDIDSRKKGARATWGLIVAVSALVGSTLGPALKSAFLYIVQ